MTSLGIVRLKFKNCNSRNVYIILKFISNVFVIYRYNFSVQSGSRASLDWNPMVPHPNRKYSAPSTANLTTRAPFKHNICNPSKDEVKKVEMMENIVNNV